MLRVKEVAKLAGISVRTLHHYDEIGLLVPEHVTEAGYRMYSERDLERLQHILFLKELDLPLQRIKAIVDDPAYDRVEALEAHRRLMYEKRDRLDRVIATLDKTIRHAKGEITMSNEEKFEGFDFSKNPYEQEARERWGDQAVDEANRRIQSKTPEEQQAMGERMNALFAKLAAVRTLAPDSDEAQAAVKEWYDFLNDNIQTYSLEVFKGLGQMYVDDERFTRNIDKFGEGLAAFLRDAMAVFADRAQQA
ncbi:MerR family transcriptional regulator [Paenibacillus sp.]|uniref:MerR family transcriptional regulator n=1 Tax=Paenibacillus sp. TaxID=58172 RepID=UPI002D36F233|nr:MerR family transcriptional regulator [Paenibacillus sp.]HZG85760.1 MerR family transcriptional regulator [Paenibacillus sp.]